MHRRKLLLVDGCLPLLSFALLLSPAASIPDHGVPAETIEMLR